VAIFTVSPNGEIAKNSENGFWGNKKENDLKISYKIDVRSEKKGAVILYGYSNKISCRLV
jgi:hypothetical protein